ncbi:hypothetical protein HPB48_002386 [Haemaphysalis longicornis]|uniref:T-complex protein 1 subunit beta n=1 Tax=Haemaphysalis longicornis TaxID=44386 RepID=A0A9J6H0B3_HAELO|nr:hypothetical protein HPB48_002386 [Haemaphysalis longicornis]
MTISTACWCDNALGNKAALLQAELVAPSLKVCSPVVLQDKILMCEGRHEGKVEVTNDGATILKAIGVDNPAAKILVDISKVQDDEVGDGTTSVAVLAAELLKEAEHLVGMKIHPQTIVAGWRKATAVAREALEEMAKENR